MRVYLAGPSAELDRVRAAAAEIEAAGHVLTEPWWVRIERDRGGRPTDAGVPSDALAASWRRNTQGIRDADRIVALALSGGGLSQGTREEIAWAACLNEIEWGLPDEGPVDELYIVGDPGPSLAVTACRVVATLAEALR